MLILAINTASDHMKNGVSPQTQKKNTVALFEYEKKRIRTIAKKTWTPKYDQTEKLLPAIDGVMKKAEKDFKDLDAVFVVNGPGSFTSLRVGVAVANAIGYALQIPVYAVETSELKYGTLKEIIPRKLRHAKRKFVSIATIYDKAPNISKSKHPLSIL